jgi:hypothetical protein
MTLGSKSHFKRPKENCAKKVFQPFIFAPQNQETVEPKQKRTVQRNLSKHGLLEFQRGCSFIEGIRLKMRISR